MTGKRNLQVHPRGFSNDLPIERFELSDYDHILPKIYTLIALIFQLPDNKSHDVLINDLRKGLEVTLSQYRSLSGVLKTDSESGKLWIHKRRESTVSFIANWLHGPESDFPSYKELEEKDFPCHLIDGDKLLPVALTQKQPLTPLGEDKEDDSVIFAAQVNFIKGGVILAVAVHHCCSDAPGADGVLTNWADNTRRMRANNANTAPFDPRTLDRSPLILREAVSAQQVEEIAKRGTIGALAHVKEPPTPPKDFVMPPISQVMLHLRSESLEQLKADARPQAQERISSYNSIMALMWRTITRARMPLFRPERSSPTHLVHAVGFRRQVTPGLPAGFLGNVLMLPEPGISISRLLGEEGLQEAAALIRSSITSSVQSSTITDTSRWIAGTPDKSWISLNLNSFLGMDLAATTWQGMSGYETQDFGFGLPKAIRRPKPNVEGYVFIFPERRKCGKDDGVELCVVLEQGCMKRLVEDVELLRYAKTRGMD